MKTCTKCLKIKPESAFGFRNKEKATKRTDCKECYRALIRKHYAENKDSYRQRVKDKRQKNRDFIKNLLQSKYCQDCKNSDWRVLEFDHARETKEFNISHMIDQMFSLDKIKEEIKKCDVVCANCHRLRGYERLENCYRK